MERLLEGEEVAEVEVEQPRWEQLEVVEEEQPRWEQQEVVEVEQPRWEQLEVEPVRSLLRSIWALSVVCKVFADSQGPLCCNHNLSLYFPEPAEGEIWPGKMGPGEKVGGCCSSGQAGGTADWPGRLQTSGSPD